MNYIYLLWCTFIMYVRLKEYECRPERTSYLSFERPIINYHKKEYIKDLKYSSLRVSRKDPRYYINVNFYLTILVDNNIHFDFYLYEFVQTNMYRRTFVELHYRVCDLVQKDEYIGQAVRQYWVNCPKNLTCPYPTGPYIFENLTLPFVPKIIPVKRGRVYINVTQEARKQTILLVSAHIDLEVKKMTIDTKKKE